MTLEMVTETFTYPKNTVQNKKEMILDVFLEGRDIKDNQRPKIKEVFEYALDQQDVFEASGKITKRSKVILPILRRALPVADLSKTAQELYEMYYEKIIQNYDDNFEVLPSVKEEFLSCLDIEAELMAFIGSKIIGEPPDVNLHCHYSWNKD